MQIREFISSLLSFSIIIVLIADALTVFKDCCTFNPPHLACRTDVADELPDHA